jgi:hypothetical protein
MRTMKLLTVIALGLVTLSVQAADPAAGRIFFTPEQRTQLDMLRKQKAIASQARDEPVPETITFNGIVRRNDGKTTVWLNNEALSESALQNKQSIVGSIGRDGLITLQAPQTAVRLKVGQSATLFSGKVDESFTQRPVPKPAAETMNKAPTAPETRQPDLQGANKSSGSEENRKATPKQ